MNIYQIRKESPEGATHYFFDENNNIVYSDPESLINDAQEKGEDMLKALDKLDEMNALWFDNEITKIYLVDGVFKLEKPIGVFDFTSVEHLKAGLVIYAFDIYLTKFGSFEKETDEAVRKLKSILCDVTDPNTDFDAIVKEIAS